MAAAPEQAHTKALPFEQWVLRYEEVILAGLRTSLLELDTEELPAGGAFHQAEGLLFSALGGRTLLEGPAEPVENPPVPRHVADVLADHHAAGTLLDDLFRALFEDRECPSVYTAVASYSGEGLPRLLGPFSVVVLLGAPSTRSRRLAYEGEWLLKNLVADDPGELRLLYERLRRAVDEVSR